MLERIIFFTKLSVVCAKDATAEILDYETYAYKRDPAGRAAGGAG